MNESRVTGLALAKNLQLLMEHNKLTQAQLAKRSGVAQSTLSNLLDLSKPLEINPRAKTVDQLADVLASQAGSCSCRMYRSNSLPARGSWLSSQTTSRPLPEVVKPLIASPAPRSDTQNLSDHRRHLPLAASHWTTYDMKKGIFVLALALSPLSGRAQNPMTNVYEPDIGPGNVIGTLVLIPFLATYAIVAWLLFFGPAKAWAAENKGLTWLILSMGMPFFFVILALIA